MKSWYENNQISAEFLQQLCLVGGKTTFQDVNLIPSKKFVTPKKVEPGMFYYADGLIFPELIKDSQVSAIVGCVDRNHGLALGLRETELPWSSDWLYVDMSSGLSGKEATFAKLWFSLMQTGCRKPVCICLRPNTTALMRGLSDRPTVI